MRISTAQFHFQSSQNITNLQSDVNEQVQYLSSGKRVLTAKDDAVSYSTLAGYKDALSSIERYQRNIIQAESHNSLQEVSFTDAENNLQALKQLFIQANNGTLNGSDLTALANRAEGSQENLLNAANTQDENGNYIFSGYQTNTKPFVQQADNSTVYLGDNGVNKLQIAKNITVETNQTGSQVFEKIPNRIGDFSVNYIANTSGIEVINANIATPSAYDATGFPPDYNFNFTSATDLSVTDSNGVSVFSTTTYAPGQTIAFNGVEVKLNGNPLPGDNFTITPESEESLFDTVKSAIDWMNDGSAGPADLTLHAIDYDKILGQLDEALNHITSRRAEVGVRLNLIEVQESNHLDSELYIASGQSNIEDLDFAKAVGSFEQSKVALQAAQQTFVQVNGLNLFNFI